MQPQSSCLFSLALIMWLTSILQQLHARISSIKLHWLLWVKLQQEERGFQGGAWVPPAAHCSSHLRGMSEGQRDPIQIQVQHANSTCDPNSWFPYISFGWSRVGSRWQQVQKGMPDVPGPAQNSNQGKGMEAKGDHSVRQPVKTAFGDTVELFNGHKCG